MKKAVFGAIFALASTAALLARGLRQDEAAKIMGANFLRVFKANL